MKTLILVLAAALLPMLYSCKKQPSAGLGGNANLKISVKHHGVFIDSATVYIKFNSSEAPSNGQYDLTKTVSKDTSGESFALFEGLKKGDYYIYATGWDPSINEDVKGGIPYTIAEETDITILIPVTETH